jgi:hypothetical protein
MWWVISRGSGIVRERNIRCPNNNVYLNIPILRAILPSSGVSRREREWRWRITCETRPHYELFEAITRRGEAKRIKDYIKMFRKSPYQMTFLYVNWQDYPLFDFGLLHPNLSQNPRAALWQPFYYAMMSGPRQNISSFEIRSDGDFQRKAGRSRQRLLLHRDDGL